VLSKYTVIGLIVGGIIVNTLEQAYNMIIKTDMDYIVMGNYIVKKL